jgi:hypothetical protein
MYLVSPRKWGINSIKLGAGHIELDHQESIKTGSLYNFNPDNTSDFYKTKDVTYFILISRCSIEEQNLQVEELFRLTF